MRLAFFDSGIGGLTVLKRTLSYLPHAEYIYYADSHHAPYGTKKPDAVCARALAGAEFIAALQPDALVVACNTATAVAIRELRAHYHFPIIGMEPAVKPALMHHRGGRILICATSLTLQAEKLENLLKTLSDSDQVERCALDPLVTFAQRFEFDSPAVHNYLQTTFAHFDHAAYESIVLGCTHFIFYRHLIAELFGTHIKIIDGNDGTAKQLMRTLNLTLPSPPPHPTTTPNITFYASGFPESVPRIQKLLQLL